MNSDFRVSVDFFTHHKARKLRKRLGAPALVSLLQLWAYAAKVRTDGNLSGMSAEDMELAAEWDGKDGEFTQALLEIGFLDQMEGGLVLHDWAENNPWVAEEKARRERAQKGAQARWSKGNVHAPQPPSNAPAMPEQCPSNAQALTKHPSSNAPSPMPIPKPEEIKTPPYPPEGGKSAGEAPPTVSAQKSKAREPTGNSLPELRQAIADYTASEPLRKTLEDFRLMRERIRRPMTGQALRLIFRELEKLSGNDDALKIAILEQSILNSWQSVFALKGAVRAGQVAGQVLSKNMETTAAVLAARQQRRQGP